MVREFLNFRRDHNAPNRLGRDNLCSKIECLNDDLSNVQVSIQKLLILNLPDEKRSRLEKYVKDLDRMSMSLGEFAHLEMKRLVQTLLTTHSVVTENIICFATACTNINYFNDFEYKIWEIAYETVYVFQKFVWFIYKPFNTEHLLQVYKDLNENRIEIFKNELIAVVAGDGQIVLEEFIHYTKLSLTFLQNYLDHVEKIAQENENMSEKTKELLSTICNYIPIYISILSDAINTKRSVESMSNAMKEFENKLSTATKAVITIVQSKSTDDNENETHKLVYHAFSFFQEIFQNMESIVEIGSRRFRFKPFN